MENAQDLTGHKLVLGRGADGMGGASTPVFVTKAKGDTSHTLAIGPSGKGKSLLPDNAELVMGLATKAFEMIGRDEFSVSASLSADNTESLRNFGLFQSILLMAYKQGALDVQEGKVKVVYAASDPKRFAKVSTVEAETVLANANIKIMMPARG